jgi:hypothetical protein
MYTLLREYEIIDIHESRTRRFLGGLLNTLIPDFINEWVGSRSTPVQGITSKNVSIFSEVPEPQPADQNHWSGNDTILAMWFTKCGLRRIKTNNITSHVKTQNVKILRCGDLIFGKSAKCWWLAQRCRYTEITHLPITRDVRAFWVLQKQTNGVFLGNLIVFWIGSLY